MKQLSKVTQRNFKDPLCFFESVITKRSAELAFEAGKEP